ncbi:MAG: hypothetical protein IKO42_08270 [Opitutales bacterium]|nr:hypothetical protein [Opitutales bacterium]
MRKYKVFWKGECVGEFTAEEIREGVGRGTFGALHSALLNSGKMVSVSELLRRVGEGLVEGGQNSEGGSAKKDFDFLIFGYALAGLAFLSPASLFGAVFYCAFLYKSGRGALAGQLLILSLFIGILGVCFEKFVLASL